VRRLVELLILAYQRRRARPLTRLQTSVPPATPKPERVGQRTPNGGAYYRATRQPITPTRVRERRFTDRTRRGLDPSEVSAFLHLVADELAALRAELTTTQDENLRIKNALRDWQSRFRPGVPA